MGVLRSVSDADEGGFSPAGLFAASDLQCPALYGASELPLEDDAERSSAVVYRPATGPTVDPGGLF